MTAPVTGVATETPTDRRAPYTFNTAEEHVDMVMIAHHLAKEQPEDVNLEPTDY
ncbi:hypothetical protein ACWDZ4_25770 [Streptomyces sp. NPDC003016]